MASVTLPYEFDTMALPRNILMGIVALIALMVVCALAMLVKQGVLAALPFPLAAAFLVWIGRKFLTVLDGSAKGTLTRDAVVVEPSALGPVPLPSPVGRHPLDRFEAVRVTYSGPNRNSGGYLFARIELVGREGTPNVCVAFERDVTAKRLAPDLAAAVELPLEQVGVAPF